MTVLRGPSSRRVSLPLAAVTELIATVRCACWPLARLLHPLPTGEGPPSRPVVLVHGYMGHPDMWRPLRRELFSAGFTRVEVVGYPSLSSRLDEIAARIDALVVPLAQEAGPVDLVGHSLGAVACRAYLKVFGGAAYVHRFVSLGGPHAGTALYRLTPPHLWEVLAPGGPWVSRLREGGEPVPTVVIRARYDHQVLPPIRASLPGVQEIVLSGYGHNGLLWSREAHRAVVEVLREG
jgi:triacylglycerol lipase